MDIAKRLKLIIKMHNMTSAEFADTIGVQRSSISHVTSGRNKPSLSFISNILEHFPKVDAQWLITGKESEKRKATNDNRSLAINRSIKTPSNNINKTQKEETTSLNQATLNQREKKIAKIIVFYNDGTFEESFPK